MGLKKFTFNNTNNKVKYIHVPEAILDTLSGVSEQDLQKIFDMPNDQNYLWGEDEEEITQKVKAFDFKKIQGIKFSDPRTKILDRGKISDYFQFKDTAEAALEAEYAFAFVVYKYTQIHNIIPSYIFLSGDVLKKDFFETFLSELNIGSESFLSTYRHDNKKSDLGNLWCNLGKIFLYYDGNGTYVIFPGDLKNTLTDENNELGVLLSIVKSYKKPLINKNKIYVVYNGPHGFEKKDFSLKKIKNINIELNYNDGFVEVSHDIITKLNNKKKTGLVILHGEPGTGKTSFIRYLATKLKKNIIFIPPDMVQGITEPNFIPFLMDNSNSILIIEDAESALEKRGSGRSGAVSNILNLTDGLLSDCINISIVATFNTSTKDIDEALLRKGRLLKAYKFDKLKAEKAKLLMVKQGHSPELVQEDMSLAEIYYFNDEIKGNPEAFMEKRSAGFNYNKKPYS